MVKYVTDLVGDRCRDCQTIIRSSVLVVASQTRIVEPFIITRKLQNIQKFRVKMLEEVIEVLLLIIWVVSFK